MTEHIISKSRLDLIHKAPRAYWHKYLNPNYIAPDPTPALIMGKALHCLIFEPSEWGKRYTIAPNIDRRTKEGKLIYEQFKSACEGMEIITKDQDETIMGMRTALFEHPATKMLLKHIVDAEKMINWTDSTYNIPCRGVIDCINIDGIVIDLKTTDDASPYGFAKSVLKYRYHVQAAMYIDGIAQSTGNEPTAFFFIAIEKTPPYLCAVYYLLVADVELGRQEYKQDIALFLECQKNNDWHGYSDIIEPLKLPLWK